MPELTPRDDDRKRVSEILKRVDQLIKAQQYEQAQRETERAKEIDPRNVYIDAYQERILALIEQAKRDREAEEARRRAEEEARKRAEEERKKREEQRRKEEYERKLRLEEERRRQEEELHRKNEEEERRRKEVERQREVVADRPTQPSKQPAKVFLIDDDEKLLAVVKQTIADAGFDVSAFTTSDEAYKVLKTETPDLILSDINLETSTMGGFSFYERIQELDHLQDVPFVFISGLSDEVLVRMGKEMGIDDYITKPFSDQHLIAVIRGKIKRYRQRKSKRKSP
jgi:PleD family two-component response regulator